jgi:hypothetical protein
MMQALRYCSHRERETTIRYELAEYGNAHKVSIYPTWAQDMGLCSRVSNQGMILYAIERSSQER